MNGSRSGLKKRYGSAPDIPRAVQPEAPCIASMRACSRSIYGFL